MEQSLLYTLKTQPFWLTALFALGSLSILKYSLAVLNWVYINFLRPSKNLNKYGSWVVITGPTDGIGKSFAFQFARQRFNLVLVARNPDKLKDVSDSIRAKYASVQIKTVVVDFTGDLDEGVKRIKETIQGLDVGILVNNVGISYPYARFLHEVDEQLMKNLLKINVEGTTRVTHAVLPVMLERKKGAIVNIGSGAASIIPSDPLYSIYAGAKAYIDQFSRSLYVEYKHQGIDVQCQVPLFVSTKMSKRRASFLVPSADTYAKAAMRCIGYEPRSTPYYPHSLIWALLTFVPDFAFDSGRLSACITIRKKGQRKESLSKKE